MATEGIFPKVDGDILYASGTNSFIRKLGSGTFESQDVAAVTEEAGSFAITEDLAGGIIIVDITCERTSGTGASNDIALNDDSASITGTHKITGFAASGYLQLRIQQSPTTAGRVSTTKIADNVISQLTDIVEFTVNAAETFYVNIKSSANTIIKLRWSAYLLPG